MRVFCALIYPKIYCRITRHLNVDLTLEQCQLALPYALYSMPFTLCPMPYAFYPLPYALSPLPFASTHSVFLKFVIFLLSVSNC